MSERKRERRDRELATNEGTWDCNVLGILVEAAGSTAKAFTYDLVGTSKVRRGARNENKKVRGAEAAAAPALGGAHPVPVRPPHRSPSIASTDQRTRRHTLAPARPPPVATRGPLRVVRPGGRRGGRRPPRTKKVRAAPPGLPVCRWGRIRIEVPAWFINSFHKSRNGVTASNHGASAPHWQRSRVAPPLCCCSALCDFSATSSAASNDGPSVVTRH
jgi:hypothetical protein